MSDARSNRCVFVSHCMLAQGVMAQGLVRQFPAVVKPVVQFCLDHDINIIQMSCPESRCAAGGLVRRPRGKTWYERNGLRSVAQELARAEVRYMRELVDGGFVILGVVGVEFSPACAVTYLNKGRAVQRSKGIYVEEMQDALLKNGLEVPFVGTNPRWHKKLQRDLQGLLTSSVAVRGSNRRTEAVVERACSRIELLCGETSLRSTGS